MKIVNFSSHNHSRLVLNELIILTSLQLTVRVVTGLYKPRTGRTVQCKNHAPAILADRCESIAC